jgi:hypothetical protein
MFKQATSSPLLGSIFKTPVHKTISQEVRSTFGVGTTDNHSIVVDEDSLDDITLQQYLDIYKKPLPDSSMQAILKLSEVVTENKKKNKKSKEGKEKMKGMTAKAKMLEASKKMISKKKCQKIKGKTPLGAEA